MMESNTQINEIVKGLIAECHTDYEGLWGIITQVKQHDMPFEVSDVREIVLQIVHKLLQDKDIVVGNFTRDHGLIKFQPWKLSVEQAVARISSEWDALGRDPSINEIAWFIAKDIIHPHQ